jgi:hypothetical protein
MFRRDFKVSVKDTECDVLRVTTLMPSLCLVVLAVTLYQATCPLSETMVWSKRKILD